MGDLENQARLSVDHARKSVVRAMEAFYRGKITDFLLHEREARLFVNYARRIREILEPIPMQPLMPLGDAPYDKSYPFHIDSPPSAHDPPALLEQKGYHRN